MRQRWRLRLVFWGGAVAVGLVAVLFALAAIYAEDVFKFLLIRPWITLGLTPAGFMLSAFLARRYFPGSEGSGIPQVIAARHFRDAPTRDRLFSVRIALGKMLLTLVGIACGASVGREGPTAQVGATIMLQTARAGGVGLERGLILAGSAAGVAAAFNTPLAGVVFAIEEMSRSFEQRTNGLVFTAVIFAGLAAMGILGNYTYFGTTPAMVHGGTDWLAVLICGVTGGVLGGGFAKALVVGSEQIRRRLRIEPLKRALILAGACGALVAVCGLLSGGMTYGTGYAAAKGAVEGHLLPWTFVPLKLIATVASSLSGIPGGLFAPSLAVGAGLGDIIAGIFGTHHVGAIVVAGMAAYFAGVTQAPITSAVIISEMTAANQMVIPLMVAAFIGFGVSQAIQRRSLYHALAEGFVESLRGGQAEQKKILAGARAAP